MGMKAIVISTHILCYITMSGLLKFLFSFCVPSGMIQEEDGETYFIEPHDSDVRNILLLNHFNDVCEVFIK